MFNRDFDPYDVLEQHEAALNKLINTHNELTNFAESLAEQLVRQNQRLDKLERFLTRNLADEIKQPPTDRSKQ